MNLAELGLPALDCHAHMAPDVTSEQLEALEGAVIFAMTRSLAEAEAVRYRSDASLLWGCGVHPRSTSALTVFDAGQLEDLATDFVLVGEIGLDRGAGAWEDQLRVFADILRIVSARSVLFSIHSAGCPSAVVRLLATYRPRGAILHWFTGDRSDIKLAVSLGCSFSVNAAMTDNQIRSLPRDRVLPETDFPTARLRTGRQPGDTVALEERLGRLWEMTPTQVRMQYYRNLRDLAIRASVLDRVPDSLADHILAV